MVRAAGIIALKDLRQRLRDRSAIVVAFIAPFGLAVIITFAFGGGFASFFRATYAVVDQDSSDLSRAFTEQVLGAPQLREQIRIRHAGSEEAAQTMIRRDEVNAAFVIPNGFSDAVSAGSRARMRVYQNPNAQIGSQVAEALARAYTDQINAARLSVVTSQRVQGGPLDPAGVAALAEQAAAARIPVALSDTQVGVREVTGANYFGPGMAIFFLFFTTGFAARSLLAERQEGTMPRILASPVRGATLVAGKAISGFVLGATSIAVMFVSLGLMFDVSWGDPLALVVLSLATVLAVMALVAVVQLFARTQEQADAYGSAVAVTLALLGGNFFPIFQLPEAIQRVSLATPNGWAMRGFTDISYDGATLADLGPHLAVISSFALVVGAAALVRARRLSPV